MPAKASILRLPSKAGDPIIRALQLALELPLALEPATRSDLTKALRQRQGDPQESWYYVMLNPEQQRAVLKAINRGPRPATTMRVWSAAISAVSYDTGAISASIAKLADYADTTQAEASRAMGRLCEIGAVIKNGRGRYLINPNVAWSGNLAKREAVASRIPKARPQLELVS